jgi:hypothetical protein
MDSDKSAGRKDPGSATVQRLQDFAKMCLVVTGHQDVQLSVRLQLTKDFHRSSLFWRSAGDFHHAGRDDGVLVVCPNKKNFLSQLLAKGYKVEVNNIQDTSRW